MAGFKLGRASEDILRELTAILPTLKDPRIAPLLTIVRIELAGDMGHCKVYVSSMQGIEAARESCEGLRSAAGYQLSPACPRPLHRWKQTGCSHFLPPRRSLPDG